MKCCKLPQWYGAQPQPLTILVHFEAVETLLMTSKMCIVLCTWFVLPCHSFLNSAHIIFVYFVLQKITSPPFSASFCPWAYAPLPPIPASTVCNEHNGAFSFVDNTVYSHRHRLGNNIWADLCPLSTFLPVFSLCFCPTAPSSVNSCYIFMLYAETFSLRCRQKKWPYPWIDTWISRSTTTVRRITTK